MAIANDPGEPITIQALRPSPSEFPGAESSILDARSREECELQFAARLPFVGGESATCG